MLAASRHDRLPTGPAMVLAIEAIPARVIRHDDRTSARVSDNRICQGLIRRAIAAEKPRKGTSPAQEIRDESIRSGKLLPHAVVQRRLDLPRHDAPPKLQTPGDCDERRVGLRVAGAEEPKGDLHEQIGRARVGRETYFPLRGSHKQLVGHVVAVDMDAAGVGRPDAVAHVQVSQAHPMRSTKAPASGSVAPSRKMPTLQPPRAPHRLTWCVSLPMGMAHYVGDQRTVVNR